MAAIDIAPPLADQGVGLASIAAKACASMRLVNSSWMLQSVTLR